MIKMRRGRTTRDAIPSMLKERKGGREGRKEWIRAYGLTPTRFFFWSPEVCPFAPHLLQLVLWVSSLHARKQNEEE